ncbi:competence protein CoiA [Arthrobacter sp. FW306-05-C]|uniref:competence protein CoiA n=1 Tax=Arthrobacter sp. FW306-05-C TaxID=2879620 RepID=UPI003FA41C5B
MRCGVPGIPRTSRRGLKHFAHKAGVQCGLIDCWNESPQHRMLKALIAQAARDAGWQASVEWSTEGRAWTADVLAERDGRRFALEVQWSRQDAAEFRGRQERYAAGGVECFWYVHRRNKDEARRANVPHVVFEGDDAPFDVLAEKAFQQATATSLHAHVTALLSGLYLDRVEARVTSVTIHFLSDACWACKRPSTIWRISAASLRSRCQETTDAARTDFPLWPAKRIETLIAADVATVLGKGSLPPLAPLRMHHSKKAGKTYLAYGCAHCRIGFFGDGFLELETRWKSVTIPVTARIPLAEDLFAQVHLCADKAFGPCSQDPSEGKEPTFDGYIPSQHQRRRPPRTDAVDVALVGAEISARDAVAIMTGHRYPDHGEPTSSSGSSARKKEKRQPAEITSCDWCGRQPHPQYECLWRQLRAKANVSPGYRHYSDKFYEGISRGRTREDEGTAMMKRLLERCVPIPRGK